MPRPKEKTSRSFAITVNPRNGLNESTEKRLITWLEKQPFAVAVVEKEGHERHLHAQFWLDKPRAKKHVCPTLQRICEATITDWCPTQARVMNRGVIMCHNDWYSHYLVDNPEKDAPNVLYSKIPDDTSIYYPSEEEQQKIMARSHAVDRKYHHYSELWNVYALERGYKKCKEWMVHEFFNHIQYNSKQICVLKDDRTIRQTIKHLHRYITCSGMPMSDDMKEMKENYLEIHDN
ncbi:MAG: putative replicase [Circoviridae sp.]|nr:MAG: putative replicase [Circoviridae sp.]